MSYSVNLTLKGRSSYLNICKILVILICFSAFTHANYVKDPEVCGNPKCKVATKFNYQTKIKYKYKYTVAISTNFDRTGSNSSNLFISALVSLSFKSHCEGVLQIKNAQISHSSEPPSTLGNKSEEFDQILSKYLLRFYFEDGTISQICPDENESIWALNIKKGILSSFQNTMERFDVDQHTFERDINGDCLVRYSFKEVNGTTLTLVKRIELSSCTNRHQLYSIIPLTPYVFQKKYHKWTPLNSTVSCNQLIDHKVYKSVNCEEQHALQPFNSQSNSAKTISKSKLTLVVEKDSSNFEDEQIKSLGVVTKRDNLLFDHKRPKKPTHDNLHECKKSILLLCELSQTVEFQPMYPDVFNKLIHTARDLTVQAMTKLYKESAQICPTGRKHMKDALPFIRNRASTKVMTDVILSQEISEDRRLDWLLIMAFFPRPDAETIDSVSRLMLQNNVDTSTMLTVTTMIHAYCQGYTNCQENTSVLKVIEKLEQLLNTTCPAGIENEITYSVLKSIGNAGVLTKTLLSTLNNCIENENLQTEIRLIAFQALRRLPCGSNDNLAISMFKNQSITEELRIAAYLHIMRCPSYTMLHIVKNVLENEERNQVGSFIWSHLKTQLSSGFPNRVDIQAMLQDENLNDKFDKDFRTFSKNYEYSFFLNNYGIGVFTEMNVIFSYKSYIPRNIVSNVTIMVFGEIINLMEINVYLEGIEQYVEKVFAESGTFNKDTIANILKIVRIARHEPNPLKYFLDNIPFKKIFDQLRVSISVRMFGNELKYYRIEGHEEFVRILDYLNPTNFIKNFLAGQDMIYEKSTMLIDTSYVTPMANGLSLKLNAVGTAAININAMGFVNSSVPASNELEMNGRLYPSVGLNFEGTLLVDAFFTQTGIRFKGTVYTSTAVEGSFLMNSYKLMRLSFNLPLQKSDIFHAETELLLVTDENLVKLEDTSIGRQKKELCTWDLLDEIIGLKLCATSLFPDAEHIIQSPLLLFTGPINLVLVLLKTDPSAKMFTVEYELTANTNKTIIKFSFNTPGSVIKRGMTADIVLDIQSQNITVAYSSTRSQVLAQGYYRNTPLQKLLNFSLDINGKKRVYIQLGLDTTEGKYGNTYFPKFLFAINDKRIVNLSGSIKWVDKKGVSQCDINIDFQTNRFETIIMGYVRLGEVSFGTDVKMHYRFGSSGHLETVVLKLELMDKSTKFLKYYLGQLRLESTAYPHISSITSLKFQKAQYHVDCHLGMVTIANNNDTGILHVNWNYEQYKTFTLNKVNTSLSILKPTSDIDFKLGFIKQETTANVSTLILVKYATGKEIITTFDLNIPHGTSFYYESKLHVIVHGALDQLAILTKIWEKSPREYDLEFTGTWFSGHNITLRGLYLDKSTLVLSSYALKFLVRSQLFNDILFNGRLINSEEEFKNDIQVEHNDLNYGLLLQHTNEELGIYDTYCKLLYNTSIYSATNHLDFNKRKTVLDLHFDQYRDVHITLHGNKNNTHIDAGLALKWDVNRDPSCKFNILLQTKSFSRLNHDGRAILEYPGRTATSTFYILHSGIDYILSVRADWSPIDTIKGYFRAIIDLQKSGILKLDGRVETPFDKWENIGLTYQMKVGNQMANCNGSLMWQRGQKLDMEASYNYLFSDIKTEIFLKTVVNSTIPTVTSLKAQVEYEQLEHEFNSEMIIQTGPKGVVAASCSGKVDYKDDLSKYLASFFLETPFLTVRKTGISAELNLFLDNKIKGIVHLIGSGKKYITTLEASLKQWNESRINFHISTPFEKYKMLSGKFSFSATRKHLLFDLRGSSILVGAEVIYIYNNISNFDLKLRTQTSFSFVNSVLVVGKINSDTVDLRVGWNTLVIGLIGSSHFTSFMDVDYSVQIFTPIEGYSKGSAIAKLIYSDRFDFEASVSLAEKKVGLKVQAMIRPHEDFAVPYTPEPVKMQKPVNSVNDTKNNITTIDSNEMDISEEQDLEDNKSETIDLLDLTTTPLGLNEYLWQAPPGTVYWRGMFQLNTPLYPTVHGVAQINEDGFDYNFIMFLSFPFGQLKMTDDLTYKDFFNIQNYMNVQTTCKCLEELESRFNIKGSLGSYVNSNHETLGEILHLNSELDIAGKVFNISYDGNTEFEYDFFPFNDYYTEGMYNLTLLIKTPFKILNHTYLNANVMTENPNYSGNVTAEINNNTLNLDGTVEVDEKYLVSNIGAKIHLSFFTLPMCRFIVHKDFTDVEKKLNFGLALPNERGDALVNYGIGGMWQYDSANFMKYTLEIITPYPAIGKMKGSIEFSKDKERDTSYLQAYLKYSNKTEIRATSVLNRNAVRFNIDSTYEIVKKININGTFMNKGHSRNFDAVYSSDREYKLVGWATVIPNRPFMVEVKLYNTKENEELLNAVLKIHKKQGGYEISASLQRHGHTFNLESDYMELGNLGKQFDFMFSTSYPDYESLSLTTLFLNKNYELMMSKVKGRIVSKLITTDLNLNVNISLKEDAGILHTILQTENLLTDAKMTWIFNWIENIWLNIDGKIIYEDVTKELVSHLHIWNIDSKYQKTSFSVDINYNKNYWWLSTNATLLFPKWSDIQFAAFVILPHTGLEPAHRLLGKLSYKDDYTYATHIINYISGTAKFDFQTLSELLSTKHFTKGAFLVKTGKHRIYDNFSIKNVGHSYNICNLLQSTNMEHDLLLDLVYKNLKPAQHVNLVLFYPKPVTLVKGHVDFTSIKNLYARMNCSTPFKSFPEIQSYLNIVTNKNFYQRLAEIKWLKNKAVFNYTQLVTWMRKMHLTDGGILLEFPLATRHVGLLRYTYESSDMKAIGQSSLSYNGDVIMSGNYTRDSEKTAKRNKDKIIINVNNTFMPVGIVYNHKLYFLDPGSKWTSQDLKSVELFRLYHKSNFSIVGEIQFNWNEEDKLTTFRAFHSSRRFILESLSEGDKKYVATANFTLKPNVWFASGWKSINKEQTNGQEMEFNISYPRRLFSLNGEYSWGEDSLKIQATANPNFYTKAKTLTSVAQWDYLSGNNSHLLTLILAHPSLAQNISMIASYYKNGSTLANFALSMEYAKDINRKMFLNLTASQKTIKHIKHYALHFYGSHPASRLRITGKGDIKFGEKFLAFNKNISYIRSYMPLQFWIANAEINALKRLIELERKSLRDSTYLRATYGKRGSCYYANATMFKDQNLTVDSEFYIDIDKYKTELSMNFTSDALQRLRMLGSYSDNRDLKFIIWRTIHTFDVNDFKILARLNNSRMFTSSVTWRPEIHSELMELFHSTINYLWNYATDTTDFWTQYISSETTDTLTDLWFDAKPLLQDFLQDLRDLRHLQQDLKYFQSIFNESYAANEFYMQDIYGMYQILTEEISFKDKMSHVPKIVNELWEVMGETGETIRQSVLWLVESMRNLYEKIVKVLNGLSTGETMDQISQYLQKIAGKYDKIIKDMHISFLHYMEELWNETGNVIAQYWIKTLKTIEPAFIQFAHHFESVFWEGSKKALEFLYEKQSELMRNTLFRTNSSFNKDMEKFYDDITKNDFLTNLKKYAKMLYDIVSEKYFTVVPFGYELNEIGTEIVGEVKELYKLPVINFTLQLYKDVYKQVTWLYDYFEVQEKVQTVIPIIYNFIRNYTNTALDNEMINHAARTNFIFKPEAGIVFLEQILPVPWHAFNITPNLAEIPEYKTILTVHKLFSPINGSFWAYYYVLVPLLDPSNWLPPFSSQAMIIGSQRLVTFDGISYDLPGRCSYLLAKDFVYDTFSLVLMAKDIEQVVIALMVYDRVLNIDLTNDVISLENEQAPSLPLNISDVFVYAQDGILSVQGAKGFFLRCNFKFSVCTFKLSGWYFGKVAGLLGTMDNEPATDFTASDHEIKDNLYLFVNSWILNSCSEVLINVRNLEPVDPRNNDNCYKLYHVKTSTFAPCYSIVNPKPFHSMCLRKSKNIFIDEICTSAFAYIQACSNHYIPIKVPTFCIECEVNKRLLEEGDYVILENESVLQSSDVIFIVEAKPCNEYMRERRIVSTFASILTKELQAMGLDDNRYAVVTFGGNDIFDQPRNIYIDNQIFTHPNNLSKYFEKIPSGHGNNDIFGALRFATRLQFRPSVSKTFILMPCSDCDITNMTVEYGVLNQEFVEKNITLHILMNTDFDLEKLRVNKMFYGLDSERAYTKNDFKVLKGDTELRRQIKLTKSMMGYCTTLALETNGTIFTGKKMGSDNIALVKKFSSVFARRIAATAQPDSCQSCECTSDNEGIEYVDCVPCSIPIPAYSDFDFIDNGTLSFLQALENAGDVI